jgi:putative two-component system response regulator
MNANNPDKRAPSILVVDDTAANLRLLSEFLQKQGYIARPVPNGTLALKAAHHAPPDLVLLDINMPGINGYEVCQQLKANERLKGIPVLFISALEDTMDKVRAFEVGGVDYITKPFQFEEVRARVDTHLNLRQLQVQLEHLVEEKVQEIYASQMSTILALAKLAESRDDDTGKHTERVQVYCKTLATELQKSEPIGNLISDQFIDDLYHATPLHDIGKVGIPDNILLKPEKLTTEEFEIIKTHPVIGSETLRQAQEQYPNNAFINMGVEIAHSHHERWDGKGYPDGLAGDEIPLSARIMTIADVYDACRTERPYKHPFPHSECVEIIKSGSGTQFDPGVVASFIKIEANFDHIGKRISDDHR